MVIDNFNATLDLNLINNEINQIFYTLTNIFYYDGIILNLTILVFKNNLNVLTNNDNKTFNFLIFHLKIILKIRDGKIENKRYFIFTVDQNIEMVVHTVDKNTLTYNFHEKFKEITLDKKENTNN